MPCWSVISTKVELLKGDVQILRDALSQLGYTVQESASVWTLWGPLSGTGYYYPETGKLETPERWDTAAIKRQYSKQVVAITARRRGWKIAGWEKDSAGNDRVVVSR